MKKQVLTICIFFIGLFFQNLFAQTANLSIQGVLRNANGTAVENGKYPLTFKLYTEEVSGTPIWEETISEVNVEGGIYSVILGAHNPLDAAFDQPYYLGVAVDGGAELIPRARLTSTPYALSLIGNDNIFPSSGNVGVGDDNPQTKLSVKRGNSTIGLEANETANRSATISAEAAGLNYFTDGFNTAHIFTGNQGEKMRITTDGKVGIGTTNPQSPLHVSGSDEQIKIEGTQNANIGLYKTSTSTTDGVSIGFNATNGNKFLIANTIGETHIEGDQIRLHPTSGAAIVDGQLEVKKNGETMKLIGDTNAHIGLYPDDPLVKKGTIGFQNSSSLLIQNSTDAGNINIKAGENGGEVNIEGILNLAGAKIITQNWFTYLKEPSPGTNSNFSGYNQGTINNKAYSLSAANFIRAKGYHTFSDKRIKKDLNISDATKDLKTLNSIEVTDYKYKDELKQGSGFTKGFIAQQVKSVFPAAVSQKKDIIPSVLNFPTHILQKGSTTTFTMSTPHQLNIGDQLQIVTNDGEQVYTVIDIPDPNRFSVDKWTNSTNPKEVFVYGKEVDDFHTVNYDQIFTLTVSATQELARKVAALEKENSRLKTNLSDTKSNSDILKLGLASLSTRMKALEDLLSATGSK